MVNMKSTNYLERRGQLDSPALAGIDGQIYESMKDYREWRRSPGGLFITSGPNDAIVSISIPITKNHSEVGRHLMRFLELNRGTQLVSDNRYENRLRELYDMLALADGAANFENGRLRAVKRYIEGVIGTEKIEGGARHKAAAYASTRGLVSHVLSEETGNITVFGEGKPVVISPPLDPEKNLGLVIGNRYDGLGTFTGEHGIATLRECGHVHRINYYLFVGDDGKRHRIPDGVVERKVGEEALVQTV